MKGLDTPVLVAILRGRPEARALVRSLHGDELCAPLSALVELEAIARMDTAPGVDRRLAAIDKLRRRLTILAVEERGSQIASKILSAHHRKVSLEGAMTAGTLEAQHVGEWMTTSGFAPEGKLGRTRTRIVKISGS